MKRTGMGMAWRGALCAGVTIALGACGGPPRHDGHPGGSDDGYSEGPRDHSKHDGDGDSDGDDLRPSHDWQKPGDIRTPSGDGISWNPGDSSGGDGNSGGSNEETNNEPNDGSGHAGGDEYVCKEKVIVPIALEGQVAPGTCYSRFDPTTIDSVYGFHDPQTNEHGDVAYRASYTGITTVTGASTDTLQPTSPQNEICEPYGAGIFAWDNDDGHMRPLAISGQRTEAGYLPPIEYSFSAPALNDADQIAFSVQNISGGCAGSALFLGNVEHRGLEILAKQGDEAPRGGVFDKFYGVSISRDGDVAFIASFVNDLVDANGPMVLPEPPPEGYTGVYVAKDGCHGDIKAIARFGDYLEGTNGGRLCGVAGPWISDYGDVLFQATCIFGGDQFRQGSLFIHRHDDPDHDVDPFLMIGDTVAGGSIGTINVGRPGMNDQEVALRMTVIGPPPAGYHQVIATKKIGSGEGDDCEPRICTQDFDDVHHHGTLLVAFDDPSIAQDGTIAFGGTFGYQPPDSMADSMLDVATDSQPVGEHSAILTCRDGKVTVIAEQGDHKPVPKDFEPVPVAQGLTPDSQGDARCTDGNEYDFRFGYLDQPSNANGHVVFRDSSEYPTGIFLSEPYCGD